MPIPLKNPPWENRAMKVLMKSECSTSHSRLHLPASAASLVQCPPDNAKPTETLQGPPEPPNK
eukprot:5619329-Amphidinium_carterae.1